jgi:hypothetical protein
MEYKYAIGEQVKFVVAVVEFLFDSNPNWVGVSFYDSNNQKWMIEDKVSSFTSEFIDRETKLPWLGVVAGTITSIQQCRQNNLMILGIDTQKPWGLESVEGQTQFSIYENQIISPTDLVLSAFRKAPDEKYLGHSIPD